MIATYTVPSLQGTLAKHAKQTLQDRKDQYPHNYQGFRSDKMPT
jgi:hypothetical protein